MSSQDDMNMFTKEGADKNMKKVYSLHFDNGRIALISTVIVAFIMGTFLFGFFIGDSQNKVYNDDLLSLKGSDIPGASLSENRDFNSLLSNQKHNEKNSDRLAKDSMDLLSSDSDPIQHKSPSRKNSKIDKESDIFASNKLKPFDLSHLKSEGNVQAHLKNRKNSHLTKQSNGDSNVRKNNDKVIPVSLKNNKSDLNINVASDPSASSSKEEKKLNKRYKVHPGFQIQIASFKKLKQAKTVVRDLKKKGFSGHISAKERKGKTYYRVSIGAGKKMDELEALLKQIRAYSKYESAFIIRM